MTQRGPVAVLAAAALALLAACSGPIASGDGATQPPAPPADPARAPSPGIDSNVTPGPDPGPGVGLEEPAIRRLTTRQIGNILRDVLGHQGGARLAAVPEVSRNAGFVDAGFLQSYLLLTEEVGTRMAAAGERLASCAAGQADCPRAQIAALGERLFRRALAPDEVAAYLETYDALTASIGRPNASAHVVSALLNSPHFLYQFESATRESPRLSPLDVASRLSFSLWNSAPDDELLAAGKAGTLGTREALLDQARRLLADPRARRMTADFYSTLMPYEMAATAARDSKKAPPQLLADLVSETRTFLDALVWQENGTVRDLYTAPFSFLNPRTATFYGLKPATGAPASTFARTTVPPAQRGGILTHGSLLTALAHPDEAAPILRGVFVMRDLLCNGFPQPPPDVDLPDPPSSRLSQRDRFAKHRAEGSCVVCHKMIDPIGFGLENYDNVGKYITTENAFPVTGAGSITLDDREVSFTGAVELGALLGRSAQARRCVVTRMFEHMTGTRPSAAFDPALAQIDRELVADGGLLSRLPLAIVGSPAFLAPRLPGGAP